MKGAPGKGRGDAGWLARGGSPRAWLWVILALALAVRLYSIGFGLPAINDPDELLFQVTAVKMIRGPTLDPGWFGHPATTTLYVLIVVDIGVFLAGRAFGWFASAPDFARTIYANPTWVMLPGRVAMALFAVATVYLAYRLGKRLCGSRAGLMAAALLALAPLNIAYSQVIRSDIMASFFMLLCLVRAVDIAERSRWRDVVFAALWLGLSVASKWPFALAGLGVAGALALKLGQRRIAPREALLVLAGFGLMAAAFLILISPYLLLDFRTVIANLVGERELHHLGANDAGTPLSDAWWYLSGPLLGSLGVVGLALAAWSVATPGRNRLALAVVGLPAIGLFALFCAQHVVFQRWILPLLPLLAILAGVGFEDLAMRLQKHLRRRAAGVAMAIVVLLALAPLGWRAGSEAVERLNDTRQIASRWAKAHVPAGSTVMIEDFAFDLFDEPWRVIYPAGDAGCIDVHALLEGKINYSFVEALRGQRSNIDYGTMAPGRRAGCRPDFAILTQYDRYRADRAVFPGEYSAYRQLIARGRILATFRPEPGRSGGPIVRVVGFAKPQSAGSVPNDADVSPPGGSASAGAIR